jgi:biopolymer transport protein ExbD
MSKRKRQKGGGGSDFEPTLELAPMLDVTFLLLIFFLCTIKFKTLEGRLDAYLPKDMGAERTQSQALENIEVRIVPKEDHSIVYVNRRPVEQIDNYDPKVEVKLPNLSKTIGELHAALPDQACVIDPQRGVPHGHVVAVLNTIMLHELEKVTFTMPAPKR